MKKLFLFLFALPMLLMATSCNSDDDLPDVNISYAYSNAQEVDDVLYIVQGDTLKIDSVAITPVNGTKQAQILSVIYRFDGYILKNTPVPPFKCKFPTANLETGTYVIGLECPIVQVGKTPATAYIRTILKVVASQNDIPAPPVRTATGIHSEYPNLEQR